MSRYNVQLPELDDDIILQTDDEGSELLRFCFNWAGRKVSIRYPRFSEFDDYCIAIRSLLRSFASSLDNLQIPEYKAMLKRFDHWAELASILITNRAASKEIEKVFFKYLRPEFEGVDSEAAHDWFRDNAPIDAVMRMFVALLEPLRVIKKNAISALNQTFQESIGLPSQDTSTKNTAGLKVTSPPKVPSQSISI